MTGSTDGGDAGCTGHKAEGVDLDEAELGIYPLEPTSLGGVIRNQLVWRGTPASTWDEASLDEASIGVEPVVDSLDGVVHGVTGRPGEVPDSVVAVRPSRLEVARAGAMPEIPMRTIRVTTLVLT